MMAGAFAAVFSSALARSQTWCYVLDMCISFKASNCSVMQ